MSVIQKTLKLLYPNALPPKILSSATAQIILVFLVPYLSITSHSRHTNPKILTQKLKNFLYLHKTQRWNVDVFKSNICIWLNHLSLYNQWVSRTGSSLAWFISSQSGILSNDWCPKCAYQSPKDHGLTRWDCRCLKLDEINPTHSDVLDKQTLSKYSKTH